MKDFKELSSQFFTLAKGFSMLKPSRVLPDGERSTASPSSDPCKPCTREPRSWSELPEHLLESIFLALVPELSSWEDLQDPRPDAALVRCYVKRVETPHTKRGVGHKYLLYIGQDWAHDSGKFVLSACQDLRQRFHIALNRTSEVAEVAIMSSNVLHTSYQLTLSRSEWAQKLAVAAGCALQGRTLGRVNYKMRVHGIRLPRRMTVLLPRAAAQQSRGGPSQKGAGPSTTTPVDAVSLPDAATSHHPDQAAASSSQTPAVPGAAALPEVPSRLGMLQRVVSVRSRSFTRSPAAHATPLPTGHLKLQNKQPHWNEALRCWCLNFRGRVKLASVKNFQLTVADDSAARMVMQFGKVEKDLFILDVNPSVISLVEALSVALTTFETKILP